MGLASRARIAAAKTMEGSWARNCRTVTAVERATVSGLRGCVEIAA
jgi:hypothetical protein